MAWIQRNVLLPAMQRGFHLITRQVVEALPEIGSIQIGLVHVYLQHTSASLTINENADPDVPADLETAFDTLAREDFPHRHTVEGPDDMPAHVKTSLLGSSVSVPVQNGKLCLGTWQGIYLCEHRNRGGKRQLVLTLHGDSAAED
jgi:secondary thiamine-phosphate synthase enzyme